MAAYRRAHASRHLQADCQEPGPAPETYTRQSSTGYLYLFYLAYSVQMLRVRAACLLVLWRTGMARRLFDVGPATVLWN